MTGTRSIDQMVEAAIWLMVQGDRAGAEELLAQVLRIDPTHERARQAMKSAGAQTSPGQEIPKAPIPNQTNPVIPAGTFKIPDTKTPLEPQPALEREETPAVLAAPPGLIRRNTIPGTGAESMPRIERLDDVTIPPNSGDLPFTSAPSSLSTPEGSEQVDLEDPDTQRMPRLDGQRPNLLPPTQDKTDRHLSLVPNKGGTSSTQPQLNPVGTGNNPALQRSWSLEVLTGPHTGKNVPVSKRPMLIGKGLGVLDVDADLFMAPGHASIFQRGGDLYISDGGSASATWVSIEAPARLYPGDSFSAGMQRFKYLGPLDTAPSDTPWPYGAPRPAASWRLEHVLVGNRPGRCWVLRGVITIGREGTHLRFPEDEAMAINHVELRPAGNALEIVDKSARAGTFVALPQSGEKKIAEGMRIRLGATVFRVMVR
ncbi:MAG: hypothetical protein QM817_05655 [Archangium sp.]